MMRNSQHFSHQEQRIQRIPLDDHNGAIRFGELNTDSGCVRTEEEG